MKKILFSATAFLFAMGICATNFGRTSSVPATHHNYIVKDTVPSDTTQPKDSTFMLR